MQLKKQMFIMLFNLLFFTICLSIPLNIIFTSSPVPEKIEHLMFNKSYKPNCPVSMKDLRYLEISHWDYEGTVQIGHMVVHKAVAQEVLEIFRELFEKKFPIELMKLIDHFDADDELSMAANNTSAFCSREITGKPGTFSLHSYGIAIDINPLVNPYIKGSLILPKEGKPFLKRTKDIKGIILPDSSNACYVAFVKRGWDWGGNWMKTKGYVDYQHFAKDLKDIE